MILVPVKPWYLIQPKKPINDITKHDQSIFSIALKPLQFRREKYFLILTNYFVHSKYYNFLFFKFNFHKKKQGTNLFYVTVWNK